MKMVEIIYFEWRGDEIRRDFIVLVGFYVRGFVDDKGESKVLFQIFSEVLVV